MNQFWSEILSQPRVLKSTFENFVYNSKVQLEKLKLTITTERIINFIFSGMGSSLFSCYIPYYSLNPNFYHTEIVETSQFLLNLSPYPNQTLEKSMLFLISQSGESGEIVELIRRIRDGEENPVIVGITNEPKSFLADKADIVFLLKAGKETSVTSKTYTSTLLILYLLSYFLINRFDFSLIEENLNEFLESVSRFFFDLNKQLKVIKKAIEFFKEVPPFLEILSSGPSLATAFQAALTYKEITKNYSEANSISSFYHGGIECLKENSNLILISSDENNFKLNEQLIKNMLKWKVGKILHISNQNRDMFDSVLNVHTIKHQIKNPFLAPIMEIFYLQLLFYKMAEKSNIEPGKFKYSKKITNGIIK